MKKYILFFTLFISFDNLAGPKNKHRNSQHPTVNLPQEPSKELAETWESVESKIPETILVCPPNSLSTSPQHKDHSDNSLGSRQSAHSSPLIPEVLKNLEHQTTDPKTPRLSTKEIKRVATESLPSSTNRSENNTPEGWTKTQAEPSPAEVTPFSDFIKGWQMWFKTQILDPKIKSRIQRLFRCTKTYDIFSDELNECREEDRQKIFDDLIKIFNTKEYPLFGYELLSEAITQAINDRQETKLHQLTEYAIPHRNHLPPAILDSAQRFLTERNQNDAVTTAAEITATLMMIHRRAATIKKITDPTDLLPALTETEFQEIANEQTSTAILLSTSGFLRIKLT
ncbi:hypothetical protein KBB68_00790 [Candidatus Babeliales bacterium]|nr:hypothetical protein [Candidatus Babeliales bacterium]